VSNHVAISFLKALDPSAERFIFQTFDDGEGKRKHLACSIYGVAAEKLESLTQFNEQGAGVFVTVNAMQADKRPESVTS